MVKLQQNASTIYENEVTSLNMQCNLQYVIIFSLQCYICNEMLQTIKQKVEIEKIVGFDTILDVYRHIWIIKVVLCTGITHLHPHMDIFSILTCQLQTKISLLYKQICNCMGHPLIAWLCCVPSIQIQTGWKHASDVCGVIEKNFANMLFNRILL